MRTLGENHPFVCAYDTWITHEYLDDQKDIVAYLKLRIICAALNEGWEPKFTTNEWRYYPWFYLYTKEELNKMSREKKENPELIDITDTTGYKTDYAGFAFASSRHVLPYSVADIGSRLCLKNRKLAMYCGKQFVEEWLDFKLYRNNSK